MQPLFGSWKVLATHAPATTWVFGSEPHFIAVYPHKDIEKAGEWQHTFEGGFLVMAAKYADSCLVMAWWPYYDGHQVFSVQCSKTNKKGIGEKRK